MGGLALGGRVLHPGGGLHPRGSTSRGFGRPPARPEIYMGYYGIQSTSGQTHPTGMHSCSVIILVHCFVTMYEKPGTILKNIISIL